MRRVLIAFALAVLLAIAVSWPLPGAFQTHALRDLSDPDMQGGTWWGWAVASSVLQLENPFWRPELNYPDGLDVTLLFWNILLQLFTLPLWATVQPTAALNIVALSIVVANGLCAGWAGREVTGTDLGGAAALIIGTTAFYGFWEAGVGRTEQGFWGPMAVYLAALWTGRWRVSAVALFVTAGCYWFYGYFLLLGTVVMLPFLPGRQRRAAVLAGAVGLLLTLPLLVPVLQAMVEQGDAYSVMRDLVSPVQAQMKGSLSFPDSLLGGLDGVKRDPGWTLPILALPLLLASLAGRERAFGVLGLVAVVLALGPRVVEIDGTPHHLWGPRLPHALLDHLPGFKRFWWPYRWVGLALPCVSLAAAWALSRWRHGAWLLPLLAGLSLADSMSSWRLGKMGQEELLVEQSIPPLFRELGRGSLEAPIAVFPLGHVPQGAMGYVPWHEQPVDGGPAWDKHEALRGEAYEARRREVGLLVALDAVAEGKPAPPGWREDLGGYRYVMSVQVAPWIRTRQKALSRLFGDPVYREGNLVIWELPEERTP